jgi:eukaryotic-like serine/threonine-protein kinase
MPPAHVASGIVDLLADPRLLPPARFDELVADILPRCDDWRIVGPELVYRGWLTPFQALMIHRGRGHELLLGSYVLLDALGEGGMGHVYRARNWKLGIQVAVKVMRPDRASDPAYLGRFLREMRALGAIDHPNLVRALDAGLEDGRLHCAMEYVPGTDLGRLLRAQGPLPVETACRYAAQLAAALQHISRLGLVHRDVKPGNVLVSVDGSAIKLGDLGLARFDGADGAAALTRVGVMIGTPDYVAPEQVRHSRGADIRSDLYSLGGTLYHMLTGRPPFPGLVTVDKLRSHQEVDPTPVEQLRPDIPADVAAVVRTLLAKRPRDRYQDPAEVVAALRPRKLAPGDTVTDAAAQTVPDLSVPAGECPLPRTEEIPVDQLPLVTEETIAAAATPQTWWGWGMDWANRLHWLIAALIAGVAMGFVIGRGN